MSEIMNLNSENARLVPHTVFPYPIDIVREIGLTRGQKIAALGRWRHHLENPSEGDPTRTQPTPPLPDTAVTLEGIRLALKLLN